MAEGGRMLQMSGVSKWYFSQDRVLDHVNLEMKKGEFAYVVGGTGAGKSTLLRILATEEYPSSGKISLFGYDLASVSPSTLQAIRRSLGFIPQNIRLIPELSVYDNVAITLSLAGRRSLNAESKKLISELLERLGLAQARGKAASQLSGGEAQRVAVARALARKPELILADEPTGAQDAERTWQMMELFVRANAIGSTIIVATHDQEIVRKLRKRCMLLRNGRLATEGAVSCATC